MVIPKAVTSCVRNAQYVTQLFLGNYDITPVNLHPSEGDLICVRVISNIGVYKAIENLHGRLIRLYPGDLFIGVLGTRASGTNVTGRVPIGAVSAKDNLNLLAPGGLIGEVEGLPAGSSANALCVEVVGFILSERHSIANLRNINLRMPYNQPPHIMPKLIVVAGASAEIGKTTLVCGLLRSLPKASAGAIKVCGTGRIKDLLSYQDAGAKYTSDFVDGGWPSTYNINEDNYMLLLDRLITDAPSSIETLIIEIGGDLLEGMAMVVAKFAASKEASFFLCVGDAMSALYGLKLLKTIGTDKIKVASFKQNLTSLAIRLKQNNVIYIDANHELNLL